MAMNKKERGELEEARHDADYLPKLAKALRWTDAKPEMDLPKPANGHTTGWSYFFSSGGYTGIHGGIIQNGANAQGMAMVTVQTSNTETQTGLPFIQQNYWHLRRYAPKWSWLVPMSCLK